MRILLVEDDLPLASFVRKGLEAEHYAVDEANDGEQARVMTLACDYDLLILDLNLPKLDGIGLLKQLRPHKPALPVLVLTARSRVEDRVLTLDSGADDCLIKPFSFSELSARVRALLRRGRPRTDSVLKVADLQLNRMERKVERGGRKIELTSKEFALLEYLMRNAGRRITRTMIIEHVWNLTFDTATNVVDVYINYASSQVDKAKMGKLSAAIEGAFQQMGVFNGVSVGPPIELDAAISSNGEGGDERNIGTGAGGGDPTKLSKVAAPRFKLPANVEKNGFTRAEMSSLKRAIESVLADEIRRHEVALHVGPEGLVVSLREMGFFDSGSSMLKPGSEAAVARIATLLRERQAAMRIEGHTDNIPIHTAQFNSNWELSTARATEMIKLLIGRYDFPPSRLSAAGYGEFHPVADNASLNGRRQNRRVDLVILAAPREYSIPTSVMSADPYAVSATAGAH